MCGKQQCKEHNNKNNLNQAQSQEGYDPNDGATALDLNDRSSGEQVDDNFLETFVSDTDPDVDIEDRVNSQIRKTISEVLS